MSKRKSLAFEESVESDDSAESDGAVDPEQNESNERQSSAPQYRCQIGTANAIIDNSGKKHAVGEEVHLTAERIQALRKAGVAIVSSEFDKVHG